MSVNDNPLPIRWCCLQHVPFEGPGHLAVWCHERGYPLSCVELWKDLALPAPDEFDGLFVLGGPMNVYEEAKYPWLGPEKELIVRAISDRKPVLGVCLGAQLLSAVLGGTVSEMLDKEIGWFPVNLTAVGRDSDVFRGFPDKFMAFHWHGDSFSIPPRAFHLAQSEACDEQAFVYENHVVGLQFHLESTEQMIAGLIENCGEDLGCGYYIQDPHTIKSCANYLPVAEDLISRLLDNLIFSSRAQCPSDNFNDEQGRSIGNPSYARGR